MTVCVAAIATVYDYSQSPPSKMYPLVVLASDRMITYGDIREYELRDQTKTFEMSDRITAMGAGATEELLSIFQAAHARVRADEVTRVSTVANIVAEEWQALRRLRNERRVLLPFGLTYHDFLNRQVEFAPEFVARLEADLKNQRAANLEAEAIVAGIDEYGAWIYQVADPGDAFPRNMSGFAAIGIGAEHADSVFMEAQYTHNRDWLESVILTFQAKKRPQVAPGVGEHTDLYWLTYQGRQYFEPGSQLQVDLNRIYWNRTMKEREGLQEDRNLLLESMQRSNVVGRDEKDAGPADPVSESSPDFPPQHDDASG